MDDVSTTSIAIATIVGGSFLAEAGRDGFRRVARMIDDQDPFGNVRRIAQKARDQVGDSGASHPISTGAFERLLHARNVDDDAVQDVWADVVAQALGGELVDADSVWALEQLGQMRGQDALLFALTARALTHDEYLVLEAKTEGSFRALIRAGNRCSQWVHTNVNTPPNLKTSFIPTPRGEPVPVGISNTVTRNSRGLLHVVLDDPSVARRWIGFQLANDGPGLAEIVHPKPLMSYGHFDEMLLDKEDGIACVAQAYVDHHITKAPNK